MVGLVSLWQSYIVCLAVWDHVELPLMVGIVCFHNNNARWEAQPQPQPQPQPSPRPSLNPSLSPREHCLLGLCGLSGRRWQCSNAIFWKMVMVCIMCVPYTLFMFVCVGSCMLLCP